jgi:hypothetical protein
VATWTSEAWKEFCADNKYTIERAFVETGFLLAKDGSDRFEVRPYKRRMRRKPRAGKCTCGRESREDKDAYSYLNVSPEGIGPQHWHSLPGILVALAPDDRWMTRGKCHDKGVLRHVINDKGYDDKCRRRTVIDDKGSMTSVFRIGCYKLLMTRVSNIVIINCFYILLVYVYLYIICTVHIIMVCTCT